MKAAGTTYIVKIFYQLKTISSEKEEVNSYFGILSLLLF